MTNLINTCVLEIRNRTYKASMEFSDSKLQLLVFGVVGEFYFFQKITSLLPL